LVRLGALSEAVHRFQVGAILLTAPFTAVALTVDLPDLLFTFVILGSPEKPKGPGEGPVAGLVDREVIGGGGIAGVLGVIHYDSAHDFPARGNAAADA
jgi:hypothetical protein